MSQDDQSINFYPERPEDQEEAASRASDGGRVSFRFEPPSTDKSETGRTEGIPPQPETSSQPSPEQ